MRKILLMLVTMLLAFLPVLTINAQDEETFTLTILHTNDQHSHHEANSNGDGGVAIQSTVVNQIRSEEANVVLLDGGDRFTGTLFHVQWQGQDQVQVMNFLGYDSMALGNHEFDNGIEVLQNFVTGLEFPAVAANIDFSNYPAVEALVAPYTVLDVNGEQVAVIGLTTPSTPIASSPPDDVFFSDDLIGVTQAAVAEIEAQGINKIILLTHTGIQTDLEIAPQLSGVDVYIGGHSHTLLSNAYSAGANEYPIMLEGADGNPIYYAQAGEYNTFLGRLNVEFDADGVIVNAGGDTILLSRYITPDPAAQALVEELAAPILALREQSISAEATVLLDGDRSICRIEECALGNLIADSIRAETGADIAIQNGGGIRANIEPGDITVGDVLTVLPFGNLIATVQLSGADVWAALENGVSTVEVTDGVVSRSGLGGRFPQVSGLRFTFDPTQAAGSRIVSVEVLNDADEYEPLDLEATYFVGTNDFMLGGGDAYESFANGTDLYAFGRPLDEALANYLTSLGTIEPYIEGRITMINAELEARQ